MQCSFFCVAVFFFALQFFGVAFLFAFQNLSGKDRVLLLYQAAAADAWDLRRFNEPWEEYESRIIAGVSTLEPRVVDTPIRLPHPPAKFDGSIYENQRGMKSRYFAFDNKSAHDKEDAD